MKARMYGKLNWNEESGVKNRADGWEKQKKIGSAAACGRGESNPSCCGNAILRNAAEIFAAVHRAPRLLHSCIQSQNKQCWI
jgi:hypothetical protein